MPGSRRYRPRAPTASRASDIDLTGRQNAQKSQMDEASYEACPASLLTKREWPGRGSGHPVLHIGNESVIILVVVGAPAKPTEGFDIRRSIIYQQTASKCAITAHLRESSAPQGLTVTHADVARVHDRIESAVQPVKRNDYLREDIQVPGYQGGVFSSSACRLSKVQNGCVECDDRSCYVSGSLSTRWTKQ